MATYTAKSNTYDGRYLQLTITQTQNIANNTSTLNWTLTSTGGNVSYYLVYATTIKINGTQVYYKGDTQWDKKVFPAAKGSVSGSITVSHNNDGSLSIPIYFYTGVYASKYKADYGGTFTLDKIPRQANITAAPNFNDEGNPVITYSNPAGTAASTLQACIASTDGQTIYAAYRDLDKSGSSYTFSLTDTERDTLRAAIPSSNSLGVRFYVKTIIGGNTFYSSLQKTMTITNGNPTLSPTVVDNNSTTTALTGDANKLVRYYSNAYYTINAGAVKKSSLSSQNVTHRGKSSTSSTGTFSAVEDASFTFTATDSRGNTTTKTITKTLINYIKLTCNQKADINVDGTGTLTVSGNYFNGSFGTTANTLTIQYRYKTGSGEYSAWTAATASLSGNSYTANVLLTGLDYQTNYIFQSRAVDKLATVETAELTTKALPIFDWGENDFAFNVPISIEGNSVADYVIEQGLTDSWYYRKWNGGSMECWRVVGVNTAISTAYGNGYYNGATLSVALPTDFFITTVSPVININTQASNAQICDATIAAYNATNRTISYYITSSSSRVASDVYVHFRVIGRWK